MTYDNEVVYRAINEQGVTHYYSAINGLPITNHSHIEKVRKLGILPLLHNLALYQVEYREGGREREREEREREREGRREREGGYTEVIYCDDNGNEVDMISDRQIFTKTNNYQPVSFQLLSLPIELVAENNNITLQRPKNSIAFEKNILRETFNR